MIARESVRCGKLLGDELSCFASKVSPLDIQQRAQALHAWQRAQLQQMDA